MHLFIQCFLILLILFLFFYPFLIVFSWIGRMLAWALFPTKRQPTLVLVPGVVPGVVIPVIPAKPTPRRVAPGLILLLIAAAIMLSHWLR